MVSCVAYGCTNRSGKPGISFHRFPAVPKRRALWTRAVRRENWQPSNYSTLCSIHFEEKDLDRTSLSCVRVREDGVPSIFLAFPPHIREENEDQKLFDRFSCKEEMNDELERTRNEEEKDLMNPHCILIKEEVDEDDQEDDCEHRNSEEAPEPEQEPPEATAASVYGLCVSKLEQRACVKFCVKLEKSAAETLRMLREAFGGEAMGSRQCFRWHARFAAGHASLEDEQRSGDGGGGRPRKKRAAHARHVLQVLAEDPSLTYREMGKALALTCPMCRKIALTDLRMHRVCGKMVPRSLTFDEKRERVSTCLDLLTSANDDPTFISRIISCGESWFFGCHSVLKGKSRCVNCKNSNSVTPWPKNPQGRLPSRGLLVVFFDVEGIIHWEFSPCTEALEGEWYCEILSRLRDAIRQKRPSLWKNSNWMLHHDNSRAHNALVTRQFLADNHVTVVPHPQCSCAPDLTPWDIAFMEGLKMRMRARAIKTPAKFLPALAKDLNALKVKDFQNAFLRVRTHWELCLNSHGDYCTEE